MHAVDAVSLLSGEGEALGLVGESGSGKTTVGRLLLRLIEPTGVRMLFSGADLTAMDATRLRALRSRVQIVFQDPFDSLNPRWTVQDLLEEPLLLHEKRTGRRTAHAGRGRLAAIELDESFLSRKPRGLGASTLQRINIARALILDPEFLVLTSPRRSGAPGAQCPDCAFWRGCLRANSGIGFLFISHDLTTVRIFANG